MSIAQTFNQDSQGNIGTSGAVSTAAPSYTSGTQQPVSLTVAGAIRTDGSATTQPVSASSLPLPTGAATSALQTTGNTTLTSINSGITAVSAQLPTTLGAKTSANSLAVVLATDETVPVTLPTTNTAALTSVASSATSVTLLSANASRKGYIIFNDSTQILYVAFGATSTTSAYSVKLFPNAALTSDLVYTGAVSGIWASANGAAKMTEFT